MSKATRRRSGQGRGARWTWAALDHGASARYRRSPTPSCPLVATLSRRTSQNAYAFDRFDEVGNPDVSEELSTRQEGAAITIEAFRWHTGQGQAEIRVKGCAIDCQLAETYRVDGNIGI